MEIDKDLITQWEPKIQRTLSSMYNLSPSGVVGFEREDLAQELRIGIMKAAKSFDETKGILFKTYLHTVLENTKRTLMGLEYRRYSKGKASQVGDIIIGYDTVWTNLLLGGLFTFFKGDKIAYNMRSDRGGGVITGVYDDFEYIMGPVASGEVPDIKKIQILTVESEDMYTKLGTGNYRALASETTPYVWEEVITYSTYSIRVRKMPDITSLDDVAEDDVLPPKILEALMDPVDFTEESVPTDPIYFSSIDTPWSREEESSIVIEALKTHGDLSEQEQFFLAERGAGLTMDEITKDLNENSNTIRQGLKEKFSDLADERQINY